MHLDLSAEQLPAISALLSIHSAPLILLSENLAEPKEKQKDGGIVLPMKITLLIMKEGLSDV